MVKINVFILDAVSERRSLLMSGSRINGLYLSSVIANESTWISDLAIDGLLLNILMQGSPSLCL